MPAAGHTRLSHGGLAAVASESERPAAGRTAGHAEKAAGHLVKSGWPDGITRLKPYSSSSSKHETTTVRKHETTKHA